MSREHELFVDLRAARRDLAIANEKGKHARKQIAKIMELIDRGETQQPLLEVIERNGQAAADPPETADERQRGSTAPPPKRVNEFQEPVAKRNRKRTERADRREVVISPNGPIRQEINLGSEDIQAINARLDEVAAADPKRKTFAVYVRDPADHDKAGRGLGYIDAASKDKALALATKRWPAIKPTELLISPPGWEQSPPPAEPEPPKPLPPDPDKEWADDTARGRLEKTDGEPDPTDRPEGAQHDSTGQRPVSQWAASVPVPGVKGSQEFLGSFLATDTEDALAVARARWPGRPDIAVRRAGPPAGKLQPKKPAKAKAGAVR